MRRRFCSGGILSSAARSAGPGAADRIAAQYNWMSAPRASSGASGATAHSGWLGVFMTETYDLARRAL